MFYPKLRPPKCSRVSVQRFLGLNRSLRCPEGAFAEMENLSSDRFPVLSVRQPRGTRARLANPAGLAGKERLAWIDGTRLFWDGQPVEGVTLAEGAGRRQMVSMGAYLVIFPDGVYFNTADPGDKGTLANRCSFSCEGTSGVRYAPCLSDGTEFEQYWIQPSEPKNPADGSVWVNTAVLPYSFKQYSASGEGWVQLEDLHLKVSFPGSLRDFRVGDSVTLTGCASGDPARAASVERLNSTFTVCALPTAQSFILKGAMLEKTYWQQTGTVTVSRVVPDMDFVTECGNRLWGCKYGTVNGKAVNEIYACALGDFKNWNKYEGLSTDSYTASRGSDGPWTGAATHQNGPLFFKENCVEKVYPSAVGAHQIVTVSCRGVQPGSHGSLADVGGVLYYKSGDSICAYDGSLPVTVSQDLGPVPETASAAGAAGDKYYISLPDGLYVYDTVRKLWHRENAPEILSFARVGSVLYALTAEGEILCLDGSEGICEERVEWMAQTGVLGLELGTAQTITRLRLRVELDEGADLDLWAEYDSCGIWEHKAHVTQPGLRSVVIPILPQRCDHLRLRLRGRGGCRIYGLTMIREEGSDLS